MFWQEDEDKSLPYEVPEDIIDISFNIICKQLPIDHAWELREQLQHALPWLKENDQAGIHQIHVAESNNGWLRPESGENAVLYPSRRTRLYLRIPNEYLKETKALSGETLTIAGKALKLGKPKTKELINTSILFSRSVASNINESENDFLLRSAKEIHELTGIKIKKMMGGKTHTIKTPRGDLFTRHLMIADLDTDPSIILQQHGLGGERQLGCGIFLPHKGIKTLIGTE